MVFVFFNNGVVMVNLIVKINQMKLIVWNVSSSLEWGKMTQLITKHFLRIAEFLNWGIEFRIKGMFERNFNSEVLAAVNCAQLGFLLVCFDLSLTFCSLNFIFGKIFEEIVYRVTLSMLHIREEFFIGSAVLLCTPVFLNINNWHFTLAENKTRTCAPNEFTCGNNRCILGKWRCDGTPDCADGLDEANCTKEETSGGKTCPPLFWQCSNGDCIRQDWQCDGEKDCADNSDETSCGKIAIRWVWNNDENALWWRHVWALNLPKSDFSSLFQPQAVFRSWYRNFNGVFQWNWITQKWVDIHEKLNFFKKARLQ